MNTEDVSDALGAIFERVDSILEDTGEAFPYVAEDDEWVTTSDGNWCGGHWIGLLWLAAQEAADQEADRYTTAARKHTEAMREGLTRRSMFYGMNAHYAGFRGYDVTGDRSLFGFGLDGADAMVDYFNESARQIPLGTLDVKGPKQFRGPDSDHGPSGNRIGAVDNIYTALPVLWRAYRETGKPRFRDVAVSHADRHLDWYIRPEGSTWHHAVFDPESGRLDRQYNELAHSDETCWARGQGWNMAGLARAYRATGAERYLNTLESAVDYYCEQSPSDGIPYWDLEAPEIPEEPRDTSAAAIAAYGLIHLGNIENKDRYEVDRLDPLVNYGEHILSSLVSEYLITTSSEGPLGVVRAGCFNAPGNYATEAELIWTTYYLAYSLTWLLDFG